MQSRICGKNCKDDNENCYILGSDNLPVQCVGPWAEDKYYFLERYLNASCEARRKFSERNNAVYIDLFAGPGKCIIRDKGTEIDSGGIRALKRDEAPFNESFLFDINEVNVKALKKRIDLSSNHHVKLGDSNKLVYNLVDDLLRHPFKRYHFIFIDPFGPGNLKFTTLIELARLDRMDMLIHFPIGAIKRTLPLWLKKDNTILDEFLGTEDWRNRIGSEAKTKNFDILVDVYKKELSKIGYVFDFELRVVAVKNTRNAPLYDLILVSKHRLAQKIWNTVINRDPDGQKSFNF